MKVLEKNTSIGAFRAVRMGKDGKVIEGSYPSTLANARVSANGYAKANPGDLVEVVEVLQAFRAGVQVMEIEEIE